MTPYYSPLQSLTGGCFDAPERSRSRVRDAQKSCQTQQYCYYTAYRVTRHAVPAALVQGLKIKRAFM